MPRASLLACLSRFARDAGADLRYGVAVEDVSRDGAAVYVASSAGTLAAPLIVGADGARSRVRDFLASESSDPSLFEPRVLPSPSGGLQYKMLRVPPSFDLKNLSVRPRGGPISRVAATTRDRGPARIVRPRTVDARAADAGREDAAAAARVVRPQTLVFFRRAGPTGRRFAPSRRRPTSCRRRRRRGGAASGSVFYRRATPSCRGRPTSYGTRTTRSGI